MAVVPLNPEFGFTTDSFVLLLNNYYCERHISECIAIGPSNC